MEETDRSMREGVSTQTPTERSKEETDLVCEEIDVEEVAIDGICGVY